MKKKSNRKLTWNPYIQIAKKIIQTHDERLKDIEAVDRDIELLSLGKDTLTSADNIKAAIPDIGIENGLDQALLLYRYALTGTVRVVNQAFQEVVEDIEDEDQKTLICGKLKQYICEPCEVFEYLGYPLSRFDFDKRRRALLRAVLRDLWLMPYTHQPASVGRRFKHDDKESNWKPVSGSSANDQKDN